MAIEQTQLAADAPQQSGDRVSARTDGRTAGPAHRAGLGLRDEIPRVGLTEYWYPVIADRDVPARRAVRRKILGQDLAFFRGKQGQVVAITNWCPHRNASLGDGRSLFPGTLSCPYHGLTFNETGAAVAFLGEGPDSKFCGRPRNRARGYPTRTLKGLVFVWMGDGKPAPIEEDVPPEFFDDSAQVLFSEQHWKVNWRASLENLQDAHVFFVHRASLEVLMQDVSGLNLLLHMGPDRPPTRVINGRALVFENPRFFDFVDSDQQRKTHITPADFQDTYPGLGGAKFPRTRTRLHLARLFGFLRRHFRPKADWLVNDIEWAQGVHMPTMYRLDYQTHVYTRAVTPVDEDNCAIFYYKTMYPRSAARRLWNRFNYLVYYDWKQHRNFSGQDKRIVEAINYENQKERFSSSDAFPLAWRRMVIDHALAAAAVTAASPDAATMWEDLSGAGFTVSFIDAGGVRTRVAVAGDGPALLLLHGTGGHLETYQKNIAPLSRHFRLIVPDMIGHGYTGRPDVAYTLDDYAVHLFALLDALGVEQAFVSGESVGGCVAAWMALLEPAAVPALVLNTGILERPDEAGLRQLADLEVRTQRLMADLSLEAVRRRMEWLVLDPRKMTDEMVRVRHAIYSQPGMVQDVQKIMHAVLEMNRGVYAGTDFIDKERLRHISCPTLVLWSDHNPGKPYERVKPAIDLIPDVRVHVVRDAAHWPQFEQPEMVNRQMIEFLTGVR